MRCQTRKRGYTVEKATAATERRDTHNKFHVF